MKAARSDQHKCAILASDQFREHNNCNPCNQRHSIGIQHHEQFPAVDFTQIDVKGPAPGSEHADVYIDAFHILRARAECALAKLVARDEENIVVFCHGTFMRAVISAVMQLGPHHAAKPPGTGECVEILSIETLAGSTYWQVDGSRTRGIEVVPLALRHQDVAAGAAP